MVILDHNSCLIAACRPLQKFHPSKKIGWPLWLSVMWVLNPCFFSNVALIKLRFMTVSEEHAAHGRGDCLEWIIFFVSKITYASSWRCSALVKTWRMKKAYTICTRLWRESVSWRPFLESEYSSFLVLQFCFWTVSYTECFLLHSSSLFFIEWIFLISHAFVSNLWVVWLSHSRPICISHWPFHKATLCW